MHPENGRVTVRTGNGLYTEVMANGYSMVVDEPVAFGGTGAGPTPYDYLLAALGGCAAMTVRMYANRKGWPLDSVRVRMEHSKIHARDCEKCENENGRIDRIELQLELTGPLDEHQRRRLGKITEKCPVHRSLDSEMLIETRA
ncbi:MAG: hypothetical protein AVDCRST_MAG37-1450 [uncultured Rubrobacteraceae bacterium]|uniref:Bll2902 protein n=1 Tax=uncultured Rubrobacteraceae bacterium TaxID=349277 RepID=A0A6J4QJP5_9ACTN|nr:MAG: hypothetical protein AVDCRST_MAG37-1450 [uncultured Rubrobacteraceae bacterium]